MKRENEHAVIPGVYRHYKGSDYEVLGVAHHSETEEPLVVYRALYGEFGLWVRPLSMFRESVEIDGEPVARFSLIRSFQVQQDSPTSDPL